MKPIRFHLNAGTGMAMGSVIAMIVALIVQMTTHDGTIWTWAIPVGVAVGLAIGAGAEKKPRQGPDRRSHGHHHGSK